MRDLILMPRVMHAAPGWVGDGGDTPTPLPGLLYLGVGVEHLWTVCSASISSDDQKEGQWFLLLGTISRWTPWDSVCFHRLWFPRRGVSRLGFPEYVREEILHQVLLMWNLFFFQKGPREKLS